MTNTRKCFENNKRSSYIRLGSYPVRLGSSLGLTFAAVAAFRCRIAGAGHREADTFRTRYLGLGWALRAVDIRTQSDLVLFGLWLVVVFITNIIAGPVRV